MKIAQAFAATKPQPVTADVVARHRFDWASRVDVNEFERAVTIFPGRSMWLPRADEFIVVSPWRNREDIASIAHTSAVSSVEQLIDASRQAAFGLGAAALVMPEWSESRNPRFYERNNLSLFEDVISFETGMGTSSPSDLTQGNATQLLTLDDSLLDTILTIDNAAFPWLWRNPRLEFEHYLLTPGVEVWAIRDLAGEPVGYVGLTSYAGWGHLDRIAVTPTRQGEGHGKTGTLFAIARLRQLGAHRVGLSTQRSNVISQRLYTRIGFQQTYQNNYRIYGTLAPGAPLEARLALMGIDKA